MHSEKLCLNSITLSGDLDAKLTATKDAGFAAISLWEKDLRGYPEGPQAARSAVARHGLAVPEFLPLADWQLTTGRAREAAFLHAEAHFDFMKSLGFDTAVVVPSLGLGAMDQAIQDLQELADLAAARKVRLAYEFLAWAKWQRDLKTSWDIVERADRSNLGLVIDSFHVFKGGSSLADLREIPIERVFIVHVVDAPEREMDLVELSRHHRVFPGEGSLPLLAMVTVLQEKGYAGWYAIEIFNDEYWKREPKELAEKAMASIRKLLG